MEEGVVHKFILQSAKYPVILPGVPASQPRLLLNPHPLALQSINGLESQQAVETLSPVADYKT